MLKMRGLEKFLNKLMGVKFEDTRIIDALEEKGFVDTGDTTLVSNYIILRKSGVEVLYDRSRDSIISYQVIMRRK